MRAILVIVVLALVLGWVGWLKFSSPDGDPTIRIDADKVKADTGMLVEKSKQAIDSAEKKIDQSVESDGATE